MLNLVPVSLHCPKNIDKRYYVTFQYSCQRWSKQWSQKRRTVLDIDKPGVHEYLQYLRNRGTAPSPRLLFCCHCIVTICGEAFIEDTFFPILFDAKKSVIDIYENASGEDC